VGVSFISGRGGNAKTPIPPKAALPHTVLDLREWLGR